MGFSPTKAFIEINAALVKELINPRFFHTYLDEDTIGRASLEDAIAVS